MRCSLCGRKIEGYGHSPSPLNGSRCCDSCNTKVVIPLRLFIQSIQKENQALLIKKNEVQIVKPKEDYFTLDELQKLVDGYIEVVPSLFTGYLDVLNEEGRIKGLYSNVIAYLLFEREYVGDVLVCPRSIFEKPEED